MCIWTRQGGWMVIWMMMMIDGYRSVAIVDLEMFVLKILL